MDPRCTDDSGVCTCNDGYTGDKCDSCADGWFMINGVCNGKFPLIIYNIHNKYQTTVILFQRVAQKKTLHLEVVIFWSVENTICTTLQQIASKLVN